MHDQVVLLRLLSSLRTAVRLLRHGGEQARFLADLVMHGTEVLTEGRLGQHMREIANGDEQHKDSPVPPALVPLAFSAFRTGMYALRGVYPELHPEVFAQRTVASEKVWMFGFAVTYGGSSQLRKPALSTGR